METVTARELDAVGRLQSVAGHPALELARRVASGYESGAAVAALVEELRATMTACSPLTMPRGWLGNSHPRGTSASSSPSAKPMGTRRSRRPLPITRSDQPLTVSQEVVGVHRGQFGAAHPRLGQQQQRQTHPRPRPLDRSLQPVGGDGRGRARLGAMGGSVAAGEIATCPAATPQL